MQEVTKFFYPWLPSKDNPADEPSRRFEPESSGERAELASTEPTVDLAQLGAWPSHQWYFIHLCSGPRRPGDLLDAVESLGREHGFNIVGVAIDLLATVNSEVKRISTFGSYGDLLHAACGSWLLTLIKAKRVVGGFASPPCSTISAARRRPLNFPGRRGPRPLRSRAAPWVPLPYCNTKECLAVQLGSALYLICLGQLGEIAVQGGWTGLEPPADRGREPYPSFFCTDEAKQYMRTFGIGYQQLDQCMFGALSRKPTGLLLPCSGRFIGRRCNHAERHPMLVGLDSQGGFRATPAAKYPVGLCHAIGECFIERLVSLGSFEALYHALFSKDLCQQHSRRRSMA